MSCQIRQDTLFWLDRESSNSRLKNNEGNSWRKRLEPVGRGIFTIVPDDAGEIFVAGDFFLNNSFVGLNSRGSHGSYGMKINDNGKKEWVAQLSAGKYDFKILLKLF